MSKTVIKKIQMICKVFQTMKGDEMEIDNATSWICIRIGIEIKNETQIILKEILYKNIIYNSHEAINFLKTVLKTNSTTFSSYHWNKGNFIISKSK